MKNKNQDCWLLFFLLLITLSSIMVWIAIIAKKGISNGDYLVYYNDLHQHLSGVKSNGVVMIYAWAMANVVCPTFIPYTVSKIYFWVLTFVLTVLVGVNSYRWICEQNIFENKQGAVVATICCMFMPWLWSDFLIGANIGGALALCAILAAFYMKKHENLAAFLLAISTIKPQIGLIFLFAIFVKKKFRLFAKTIIIILISLLVGIIYVNVYNIANQQESVEIVEETASQTSGSSSVGSVVEHYTDIGTTEGGNDSMWFLNYGLFNPLVDSGVPVIIVLMLSAASGAAFVFIFIMLLNKGVEYKEDDVLLMSIATLASLFWCYKSQSDSVAIILCNIVALLVWKKSGHTVKAALVVAAILVFYNCVVFKYIFRFAIPLLSYDMGVLFDMISQIVMYALMFTLFVKREEQNK